MRVCIAEKPSVAREIAAVLGANTKKEGYYEGPGVCVTWTLGHLCQLYEPEDYDPALKRWTLESLPILPTLHQIKLQENPGVKKQFKVICQLFRNASEIVNCGDAGQEGELIQRWVYELSRTSKPLKRLWISSLTDEAIREGFEHLRQASAFDPLYQAGLARAIGDWLLGMNATRLFSKKYGSGKQPLSLGRVQTPTLAMVVARQRQIEAFQPEPYWELRTLYREVSFRYAGGKFLQEEKAQVVLEAIRGQVLKIQDIKTQQGKEAPPQLYDLTTAQMDANRKWGLRAEETLKTLQTLYERKWITYPRVDTRYLSQDLYPKIPEILRGLAHLQIHVEPLLGQKIRHSSRVFNDVKVTDHHAIIPTGKTPRSLGGHEQRLYDLISRRFVAAFYPDCEFAQTTVMAEVEGHSFKVVGKQILSPGWQVVYENDVPQEKPKAEEDPVPTLPAFQVGEHGAHQPSLEKKMTKPPRPYTEATLLRAMETAGRNIEDEHLRQLLKEHGIGRPATRAAILETLFKREYLRREKRSIWATAKGCELIDLIQNPILKSAELTGKWEKQLRAIEQGEFTLSQFIEAMNGFVHSLVAEVKAAPVQHLSQAARDPESVPSEKSLGACPQCQKGQVVPTPKGYGCTRWKKGCPFRLWGEKNGQKLTEVHVRELLSQGQTSRIAGFLSKAGKIFEAALKLTPDFKLEFIFDKVIPASAGPPPFLGQVCPQCGLGTIIRGKRAYGCNRWKEGCTYVITPDEPALVGASRGASAD